MPVVTLRVSDTERELWVEAAGKEGVSLSEWLRQAASSKLAFDLLQKNSPSVITPELTRKALEGVATLVEATAVTRKAPPPSKVSEAAKRQFEAIAIPPHTDLIEHADGICDPDRQPRAPSPEQQGEELKQAWLDEGVEQPTERDLAEGREVAEKVGVEEVGEATPPTAEGLVTPNNESSASTPSTEGGEQSPAGGTPPSASSEAEEGGAPTPPLTEREPQPDSESEASASQIEKLTDEARQLLEGRPFKPDFKVEKKPKKKKW